MEKKFKQLKLTWVNFWTITAEFWEIVDDWNNWEAAEDIAGTEFVTTEPGSGIVPGRGIPMIPPVPNGRVPVTENPAAIKDSAGWSHFLFFLLEKYAIC